MSRTPEEAPGVLEDAARRGARYLAGVDARGVSPEPDALARLAGLGGPLPDEPSDPYQVLALLDEIGSPATTATAGGRYFGLVVGGAQPAALGANVLAAAWDQVAGLVHAAPGAAAIEEVALAWVLEALDLPRECAGGFVTGATMGNLCALVAARHALLARRGWDVERRGLFGAPEIPVVVGEEAHASLKKALALVGLGHERVQTVPTDGQGRMRADQLPDLAQPALVCLQAGNVNTGAFDPASEVCERARESGSWVHVDGAFGLWARAAPGRAALARGYELADSWATDGHKWLNVPYDCGIVVCRDGTALRNALALDAPYLMVGDQREPYHSTPEMSRRARGVEVWAALRALGRSGLADLIERTCRHARRLADGLAEAGHEVLNDVALNQVLVSFGDDEATDRVCTALQSGGTCWCGTTTWHGRRAMRISVSSWATTGDDVERALQAMLTAATA